MKEYPLVLRKVWYHDDETGRKYMFLTNDFGHTTREIADIYKTRWQIELFFKWIKQNLKVKTFWERAGMSY
jgi:IS4 transposase